MSRTATRQQGALTVRDLEFGYGAAPTVSGISLDVAQGERVAIIGGNGAGKSTVLKLVAGIERPWSGSVQLDGRPLPGEAHAVAMSGLRMTPQGHPVFNSLTIHEHLQLAADLRSTGARTVISPDEAYRLFPRLAERSRAMASSLSGGERAFLGLAQVLVAGCSIMLLDEPSAGLAPAAMKELFALLYRIGTETGVTMLIVEQNAAAAMEICDRLYVMSEGRILLSGTPAELSARDDVVAAYLSF